MLNHVVHKPVPRGHGLRRLPTADVLGEGAFNLACESAHATLKGGRLKQGVDQVGVAVDEPLPENGMVQDMVEQQAVRVGKSRIARVLEVVV